MNDNGVTRQQQTNTNPPLKYKQRRYRKLNEKKKLKENEIRKENEKKVFSSSSSRSENNEVSKEESKKNARILLKDIERIICEETMENGEEEELSENGGNITSHPKLHILVCLSVSLSIIFHYINLSIYNTNTMFDIDPSSVTYKKVNGVGGLRADQNFASALDRINSNQGEAKANMVDFKNNSLIDVSASSKNVAATMINLVNKTKSDPIILKLNSTSDKAKTPSAFYTEEELSKSKKSSIGEKKQNSNPTKTSLIPKPTLTNPNLTIPEFSNLKDSYILPSNPSDHAVFLHFPKTGGTTTKNILGVCHKKVLASEAGIKGHAHETELQVVKGYGDSLFVNVDTTTKQGVQRAISLNFAQAHLSDLTVTPMLYSIDALFTSSSQGRLFSMFRDPIERAVSMLNYIKYAEWEPSYIEEFKTMTLEEYARSPYVENNFYTRVLSDSMEGALTDDHLQIAIYNLKTKILVGILDQIDDSIDRFEQYFNWKFSFNPTQQEKCRQEYVLQGANVGKKKFIDVPQVGSEGYELLAWQNQFDLKIYKVVLTLFHEQKVLVEGKPKGYRMVDTTCSECLDKMASSQLREKSQTQIEETSFSMDVNVKV